MTLQAGLAAACRANAAAISKAGWDTVLNDYPGCLFGGGVKVKYSTNYLHFHPDHWQLPIGLLERLMEYRRNIAYWAWETDRAPDSYREFARRLDQVWVPSQYVRGALGEMPCPVHVVPHAVPRPPKILGKATTGQKNGKFRIGFAFDGKSRVERKNPWGVIKAFRLAFPRGEEVELVIKAHGLSGETREALLAMTAMDERIHIMEGWADAAQVERWYQRLNVFLGLQRSEGFGLHLAEAMAHGCIVITTGYGGHTDFIQDERNAYLVPFTKVKITDTYYAGSEWAEPDLHAAAERLAWVYDMWDGAALDSIRYHAREIATTHSEEVLTARIATLLDS